MRGLTLSLAWLLRFLAWLLGLPLLAVALILMAANTQSGRQHIERLMAAYLGDTVIVSGISGRFPDALQIERIELLNSGSPWLTIEGFAVDWSPLYLLGGIAEINLLAADAISIDRLPASGGESSQTHVALPVNINLHALHLVRLNIAQQVLGNGMVLTMEGSAGVSSWKQAQIDLSMHRLGHEDNYLLQGRIDDGVVSGRLAVHEAAGGLLSYFAQLPDVGALAVEASMQGPPEATEARMVLQAGSLQAGLQGKLDFTQQYADMVAEAHSAAMQPRPDYGWQSMSLKAKLQGPFAKPNVNGTLRAESLHGVGLAAATAALALQTDNKQAQLRVQLEELSVPGMKADSFPVAGLTLQADAKLDDADLPVTFSVRHPALKADGNARLGGGKREGELALALPDLRLFAANAGIQAKGDADVNLRFSMADEVYKLEVEGRAGISETDKPWLNALGESAKFSGSATAQGRNIRLSALHLKGKAVDLSASGEYAVDRTDLDWQLDLSDLKVFSADMAGRLAMQGRMAGPIDKFEVSAELQGDLAVAGSRVRGPLEAKVRLKDLPHTPVGDMKAHGILAGAPLELAASGRRIAAKSLQIVIDSGYWKSAHAKGSVILTDDAAKLPVGSIELRIGQLSDFGVLFGEPWAGGLSVNLDSTAQGGRLIADGRDLVLTETASVKLANLSLNIVGPMPKPVLNGQLKLEGVSANTLQGSTHLDMTGPLQALNLKLSANMRRQAEPSVRIDAAAKLNNEARNINLADLQVRWQKDSLQLLEPARIDFAKGVNVNRLQLGYRQGVLELAGYVSPVLDCRFTLRNWPAALLGLFTPGMAVEGMLQANANLKGSPSRPKGSVHLELEAVRLRSDGMPPLNMSADAGLNGESAMLNAKLDAGAATLLNVTGQLPFSTDLPLDLHADGSVDLRILDPMLLAGGQRLRGQAVLNAGLAGSIAEPQFIGGVQVTDGEYMDYSLGARIGKINAALRGENGGLLAIRMDGKAGQGTITVNGSINMQAAGWPIDVTATARNARPLSSDQLTADLDGDLILTGLGKGRMEASGEIRVNRAEIRIPEQFPVNIAVLNVHSPGGPPHETQSAAAPAVDMGLNMDIKAPSRIFVRGRGIDAELGGTIRLSGTATQPQWDGGFDIRRGEYNLAGKTLVFQKGRIGFENGGIADPDLNFSATTSSANVSAVLNIGGSVRNPKITLSSTPVMPQDEILAYLLFNQSTTSLSPFEMVQIAEALASLTGVYTENPLETARKKLGLDRLTVAGSTSPTLEAGRYIARGVYLGTKQGTAMGQSQATVQVDVTKRLKLEGSVAAGGSANAGANAGSSMGLLYQIEY